MGEYNLVDRLRDNYSRLYLRDYHDSPDKSRVSMARRIVGQLKSGIPTKLVVDIGSGAQALEKTMLSTYNQRQFRDLFGRYNFLTLDLANIKRARLLAQKRYPDLVMHVVADGSILPVVDKAAGLVFSNMAIDFMPEEAFSEAYRILVPEGTAFFNFHHPDMISEASIATKKEGVRKYWKYLESNQVLFSNQAQIIERLEKIGYKNIQVSLNTDGVDKWWEVSCKK